MYKLPITDVRPGDLLRVVRIDGDVVIVRKVDTRSAKTKVRTGPSFSGVKPAKPAKTPTPTPKPPKPKN